MVAFTNRLGNDNHTYVRTESVRFLRYDPGGTWTDLTREVIGGEWHKDVAYVLPREGTAVRVSQAGRLIYLLTWDPSTGRFRGTTPR